MPLPSTLVSTYQQYKQDTDVVAKWLAHTGMYFGCPDELLRASGSSSSSSHRQKGKARKAAKKAQAASKKNKNYVLATQNYQPLAQFIVDHHKDKTKDVVDVPVEFSRAINRAISVRRQFAALLAKAGATMDMTADDNHNFFVGVLEKVRDILKPLFWHETSTSKNGAPEVPTTGTPKATPDISANPFSILDDYELPELNLEDQDSDAVPTEETDNKNLAVGFLASDYESEATDSAAERFMVFLTLGRDLNALREQVKTLWKAYANRELSLSSVAVATNTAISLARAIEEPLSHIFKPDGHVEGMLMKLLLAICALKGVGEPRGSRDGSYPFDIKIYEMADFCMLNALLFNNTFLSLAENSGYEHAYNGRYGWYDKTVPYHTLSNQGKFKADSCHISEAYPEFSRLARLAFNAPQAKLVPPVLDELTRGLHLMAAGHVGGVKPHPLGEDPKPLWMMLAMSLNLDTVRILGDEIDRPFREMMAYNVAVKKTIDEHFEYHSKPHNLRAPGFDENADKMLKKLQKQSEYWNEGEQVFIYALKMAGLNADPTKLLRRHPLYCGLWVADFRVRLHHLGVAVNSAFGGILYAGHLYNALEAEGLIPDDKKWDDMELFFNNQGGRDKFFIGQAPTNFEQYHRQLCMVMGFSAGNFTPDTRNKGKLRGTAKGPRALLPQGPVSLLFAEHFKPGGSGYNLTADDVQTILSKSTEAGAKKQREKTASPVQLVAALARQLESEIPALMPDYLLGHRIAWTLFRAVRDAIQDDMLRWLGPKWITAEYQLPFTAGYIFRSLCGDGKIATRMLLEKAAGAYRKVLCPDAEEGGADGGREPRREVTSRMEILLATAKLRVITADPVREAPAPAPQRGGYDEEQMMRMMRRLGLLEQ
ncbi:hypothetical protein QBC39DRAFT_399430 [Podospora conica]|nr:hypothetical protein QBC39DRAFT_399430 [Schizothecium conicum]